MPPSPFAFLIPCLLPLRRNICPQCIRLSQQQQQQRRRIGNTAQKILNVEKPNPESYTPTPLSRPIGVPYPPKPGEHSGIDSRTWREKRDDMFNYDKHLIRREQLTKEAAKPYFQDWSRTNYHRGKTFIAPSRIFRAEKSLYFPNMVGVTLASPKTLSDTTPVLRDRISVVGVYSGHWAELQTHDFVKEQSHPELADLIAHDERHGGPLQRLELNIEDNWMKALIVRTFMRGIKKERREQDWGRYFLVSRGVTDEMREAMAIVNSKAGYVYLVDWLCRIRWAGSANAQAGEKEALVMGAKRLLEAWKTEKEASTKGMVGGGRKAVATSSDRR
ncbi:MAG: hypothetical protein LQ341_007485 [Variospora aurantia]|nr:MAG: hypothetical protein LQ341_007485 [Variospora aurantia]